MTTPPERLEVADQQSTPLVLTLESSEPHENGTLCRYTTETGDKRCDVVLADGLDTADAERAIVARLAAETAHHAHEPHDPPDCEP